jgi:hypothetical protein
MSQLTVCRHHVGPTHKNLVVDLPARPLPRPLAVGAHEPAIGGDDQPGGRMYSSALVTSVKLV